jgi:hypothetical protein
MLTDNVFDEHGLMGYLEKKVGVDRVRGGDNLLIPVSTSEDANGGSYSGYDTFDTDPSDTVTNAVYGFAQYQQPIIALFSEVARNRSPEGAVDMWLNKVEVANNSLHSKLNTDVFADGTGNSGKNILGLTILVDSTGTVGNIARASNAYWAGQELASGGALAIDTTVGMLQLYNNCSTGSGDTSRPDIIVTTQAVDQSYENLLSPDIRHTSQQTGDGTFSGLAFKGVPFMWDADATSGILYMLNASSFEMFIHPERDYTHTEIAKADNGTLNQDAWIGHILVYIALVLAEGRRNGKLTGISAS